jgi:hypothetical protein
MFTRPLPGVHSDRLKTIADTAVLPPLRTPPAVPKARPARTPDLKAREVPIPRSSLTRRPEQNARPITRAGDDTAGVLKVPVRDIRRDRGATDLCDRQRQPGERPSLHLAGITTNPTGHWTAQAARNFMMRYDRTIRFLIHDGASQFNGAFDEVFRSDGTTIIRTPPYTPLANAYGERWVGTVRRELCDRTLIWNRRQLQQLLGEYVEHYNTHRPHRSLRQRAPDKRDVVEYRPGQPIRRHTSCGGLINQYRHAA